MSGNVVTDSSWSSSPMPETFRFSPNPNQAHKIDWRPWGKDAFDEAMRLDKPVFLLITSSWCQWCHIMDETTLSEPGIITIVNHDYIPVRVDSDLRPDVNQRYNQNGWPSVALLSSEGEILWGGVYVPPKQMLYYLGHVRRYYSEHRQEIAEQVHALQNHRFTRKLTQSLSGIALRSLLQEERDALEDLPDQAGRVLQDLYDADYGGFTIHPHLKFPHPEALELLLLLSQRLWPDALDMVRYSLEQMCDGGLWDKEDGGFFRYSAASDWSMPHTEKMLEENAALLRLVTLTAQVTQDQRWYDLARRLLLFINNTLWQPDVGIFSGSQSADEEYYEPGPYSRASQEAPHVDTTIYTAWNARMISSYILAARVLNSPSLDGMARRALHFLCDRMQREDGCFYHYAMDGHTGLPGQLADQVWMMRALLDAYERYGCTDYLETAMTVMEFTRRELLDNESGLFYDGVADSDAVGRLALREQPLSENAVAAECLLHIAIHSQQLQFHDSAVLLLARCLEKYRRSGIQGVVYACVVAQAVEKGWL